MPATEKVGKDYLRGRQDARKLDRVLDHLVDRTEDEAHRAALIALKEEFNATDQNVAIVYGSM